MIVCMPHSHMKMTVMLVVTFTGVEISDFGLT